MVQMNNSAPTLKVFYTIPATEEKTEEDEEEPFLRRIETRVEKLCTDR